MVDGLNLRDRCAALQASVATLLLETPSDALCKLVDELSALASDVATKEEALRLHEAALREREARVDAKLELLAELKAENHQHQPNASMSIDHLHAPAKTITLNVGGTLFTTARETLLRMPGSYFDAMLSSDHWLPNEKGEYFLDLDASTFKRVIKYLRTGTLNLSGLSNMDADELREMLDYLQIEWPLPAPSAPLIETTQLQWDPLHCSEAITLDEDNTRARSQKHGWNHVLTSTPATTFGVLVTLRSEVLVGFMDVDDFVRQPDFRMSQNRRGWVFDCSIGALRSHHQPTTANVVVVDTTKPRPIFLQVTLHQQQQRVSFAIDGTPLRTSLHHVPTDAVLYPVVRILSGGAVVKLLPV